MGRYYNGDIEGKFWFAVQSSDASERFGGTGYQPAYTEYDFGEDDFGGDVFDVEEEAEEDQDIVEEESEPRIKSETLKTDTKVEESSKDVRVDNISNGTETIVNAKKKEDVSQAVKAENNTEKVKSNANSTNNAPTTTAAKDRNGAKDEIPSTPGKYDDDSSSTSRRELIRNRAPPAGYSMGPAGSVGMDGQS